MKRSTVVLIAAALAVTLSSCSVYSCPTYAKVVKPQPAKKINTQNI